MAKNISLLGADYPDVPAVVLPKTGGGSAMFVDADDFADLLIGEIITISGTTDNSGQITEAKTRSFASDVFVLTNVSKTLANNYSVTVESVAASTITFRIRKMSDNSAIANTAVNFPVLVVGRKFVQT